MTGFGTRPTARTIIAAACITILLGVADGAKAPPARTSTWPVPVTTASSGLATSGSAPATPTGVTSACSALTSAAVTVSWTASPHATSYTIYQSTTSATTGYTEVATATTSPWTSGTLALGSYWYEVAAGTGLNWASPRSTATAQRTIVNIIVTACT